ncbi:isopenicillin N synthase family dioxygenase [Aeromicrobium ginsengisoli]|uniref:Isopenicillin N synthase family oxygenase n=1 Tax=Aeromicrobium ginsengisoli TaxID=363867 RepID=A0A5M4FH44_9ACTN|nr:2-oxoglutarate and iron-dependent oxygenase domain-containing protein [Aeromicrobium ginsengisoli]KAA1398211.1 isopenicillin N synthase family oxygenase [Aeromicrobium ginsengisoli]
MRFSVPTVDIGPYVRGGAVADRDRVAAEIDAACREVGFIQVIGHGVPDDVITGLTEAIDAFFDLPVAEKLSYVRPAWENRGYSAPRSESLSLSAGVESATRMNDFFEAFNVGSTVSDHPGVSMPEHYAPNTWPALSGFEGRVTAYADQAQRVAGTMVEIFTDALGLPRGFFDAMTDASIEVLRMNNYALPAGTEIALDADLTGMGEHTDFGIVTVLWADQAPGLQVLGADGVWHDVAPADGALLINLGDLMARWTNERWMSTLHRVKPPIVDGTIRRRRSAAFFHDGNAEAVVTTLPACVDADHPNLYAPVTIAEHIAAKLAGSRVGVINVAAERESARVMQSQR